MPTYTFINKNTGEEEEHFMKISVYDQFKLDNPHLERFIRSTDAPGFGCPVRLGITKTDDGWKEVLSKVADSQPKSNLKDTLSRNS